MPNNEAIAAAVAPVAQAIVAAGTAPRSWYAINKKAQANDTADISIYDEIGGWGITARQFVADLKAINAGTINLRLNTPGGEITEGTAIYNALKEHPARIVVHVEGVAASAGSFIAMSGDEVRMADNAYLMIHNGRAGIYGEATDMRKLADVLDKMNGNIADMYGKKTGKSREHYRALMDAETWFTAEEAKDEGLADAVYEAAPQQAQATASECVKFYNKIPDGVRRMWGIETNQPAPEDLQRCEPPPANTKESSDMSDSNKAAPAPTPAAPSNGTQPQETPTQAPTQDQQIAALRTMTNAGFVEQGKKVGREEGAQAERDRFNAIVLACPGKPQLAIDTFTRGQDAVVAKLAFEAEARADARTSAMEKQKDLEIQRLNALLSIGGSPGVALSIAGVEDSTPTMEPKAQAEWEWENKPEVRKTARTKDIYVIARAAELDGTHRSFTRAAN